MDSSNSTANNILDKDNWSNSLLVKDEKGNLAPLKKPNSNTMTTMASDNMGAISDGQTAPADDSFVSMQNIAGTSQDKAELVFHPDDKEELEFLAKNIPQDDSKKYSVEKIVARIIEKQNFSFDDKNKKIFTNILYNFFRSRKSAVITRDLLKNNVLINNKKLSEENVDTILSVIKSIKGRIESEGGLVVNQADLKNQMQSLEKKKPSVQEDIEKIAKEIDSEDKHLSAQDEIQAVFSQQSADKSIPDKTEDFKDTDQKDTEKIASQESKTEEKRSDEPKDKKPAEGFSLPSSEDGQADKKLSEKSLKTEPIDINVKQKEPEKIDVKEDNITSLPKVSRPGMSQTPKKAINDVVKPSQSSVMTNNSSSRTPLTGPVQELQSFDLVGFRRLGESADERVDKILEKINLLEQESYTKKAEGIAAWRKSDAYQLYLKIGAESMVEGKKVEDYIKEQEDQNQATLSFAEFSAISDLNKQLRF